MKRFLPFILISLIAFQAVTAQNPNCNAAFTFTFLTGTQVKFVPVVAGDTNTVHSWSFGDGGSSTDISPTHVFQAGGTYAVVHTIMVYSNGLLVCSNSYTALVHVSGTTCNLVADFSWMQDTTSNAVYFQNQSSPIHTTDSVRWTFGDGTSGNTYHATHTYTNAGSYIACLRIWQRVNGVVNPNCFSEHCDTVVVTSRSACNLVLSFTPILAANTTNNFTFHNTSAGIVQGDSIRWTYGDGTSGNSFNGSHVYTNAGTYTVCLRVIKRNPNGGFSTTCVREYCRIITVTSPCNLTASFTFQSDSLSTIAHFFNTTASVSAHDSVRWNFGDGTFGTGNNPTHTYAAPGTYNVCLLVIRRDSAGHLTNCASDVCHTVRVGTVCNLQAAFTYSISPNTQPGVVAFTGVVTGYTAATDSISWTFGDSTTGTGLNITHTYANPGTYRVCMRVKRTIPGSTIACVRESCMNITIAAPCNLSSAFSYTADTANGLIIHFNNLTNATIAQGALVNWTFGDGTGSTAWSPAHNYTAPGAYRVCLRVQTSSSCIRYYCDTVFVHATGNPCYVNSEFTYLSATATGQVYTFRPRTINANWSYHWNFGDNTGSQDTTPTHQYQHPGTYTVCLTVTVSATCSSTTCRTIVVQAPFTCDSIRVTYTYQKDAYYRNKVYFYTQANYPVLDETWTITRLPQTSTSVPVVIHRYNPIYYFRDTGTYRVCLRAVTLGGCIKESCQNIRIDSIVAGPNACFLQVYPNPASSYINLSVSLTQPETIHVYIYNSMNMLVRDAHYPGSAGWNTVPMFVGNLPTGYYYVRVIYGNTVCYSRFYKN